MQTREIAEIKILVFIALAIAWFLPIEPTHLDASIASHLTAPIGHANGWHLFANLYALWLIPFNSKQLTWAYLIAIIAMIPNTNPTIGFSAAIYAIIGMNVPNIKISKTEWAIFICANAITCFIPNIAVLSHAIAFFLGICLTIIKQLLHDYNRTITRE